MSPQEICWETNKNFSVNSSKAQKFKTRLINMNKFRLFAGSQLISIEIRLPRKKNVLRWSVKLENSIWKVFAWSEAGWLLWHSFFWANFQLVWVSSTLDFRIGVLLTKRPIRPTKAEKTKMRIRTKKAENTRNWLKVAQNYKNHGYFVMFLNVPLKYSLDIPGLIRNLI